MISRSIFSTFNHEHKHKQVHIRILLVDVSKIVRLGGTHDFKAGFGRQKMVNNVNLAYGGGGYVTLYWNTPYADPVTKRDYTGKYGYYTLDDIGTKGTTGGTIDNIYFQDRWKATSRLSLDLGLRLERERCGQRQREGKKHRR